MRGVVDVSWGGPFFQWQKLAKIGKIWQIIKQQCMLN